MRKSPRFARAPARPRQANKDRSGSADRLLAANSKYNTIRSPGQPMIENFRTHLYTRGVCLETARLFEKLAANY